MRAGQIWFEVHHKPFEDGTPRHPLLSLPLSGQAYEAALDFVESDQRPEVDPPFYFYELVPGVPEHNSTLAALLEATGVQGSIWVEYEAVDR